MTEVFLSPIRFVEPGDYDVTFAEGEGPGGIVFTATIAPLYTGPHSGCGGTKEAALVDLTRRLTRQMDEFTENMRIAMARPSDA